MKNTPKKTFGLLLALAGVFFISPHGALANDTFNYSQTTGGNQATQSGDSGTFYPVAFYENNDAFSASSTLYWTIKINRNSNTFSAAGMDNHGNLAPSIAFLSNTTSNTCNFRYFFTQGDIDNMKAAYDAAGFYTMSFIAPQYSYNTTNCAYTSANQWRYGIVGLNQTSNTATAPGIGTGTFGATYTVAASSTTFGSAYMVINGASPISITTVGIWSTLQPGVNLFSSSSTLPNSFNIGGVGTTTVNSFCDSNMPYDNSSIIQATLTYIPNGLCRVGAFLVIPTSESLNNFSTLSQTTKARFPFSYINNVITVWNSLTASSTENSPSYTYNLADLGIGSTTALGNILPDVTVFSASTTKTYFPPGTFDILKNLARIAIILTLIGDIFFTTKNMLKS